MCLDENCDLPTNASCTEFTDGESDSFPLPCEFILLHKFKFSPSVFSLLGRILSYPIK